MSDNQGEDIYKRAAANFYDIPYEKVTKAQRDHMQVAGFGVLYRNYRPKDVPEPRVTITRHLSENADSDGESKV